MFQWCLSAEIPSTFFLQKVSAAKWLGLNVTLWGTYAQPLDWKEWPNASSGITTVCTASVFDYRSLLASRIILGIFEAAIAPSLILISSQWYTKSEQAPRFSFWYCGLGVGQILGGLASYAFQQVHHMTLAGWRIMFLVIGFITIVIGIVTFSILPGTPMTAKFLSDREKVALLKHISVNQTGMVNRHFKASQLTEMLLDVQIWLLSILTILVSLFVIQYHCHH